MSIWGHLASRYEGVKKPRKLLALDGGGIRGIVTLEILIRIEELLANALGKKEDFRLCDYFDYIAGTSTGAIIAAGLARGMSARQLRQFYLETGPAMFDKAFILARLRNLYESQPLAEELKRTYGENTNLFPEFLRCLLLIVTRNVTTDSPWPISSNPLARYNNLNRADCNLKIPLWQLVRASTAAPIFFAPEVLQWDKSNPRKAFVFEDGGVTPYNNPSFLLFRMVTQSAYNLCWDTGETNLLLISLGTGSAPNLDAEVYSRGKNVVSNLTTLPSALMYGSSVDQDINCRMIGHCVFGSVIDRELGDMIIREPDGTVSNRDHGRAFRYARYNADISFQGLHEMGLGHIDCNKVGRMDSVQYIDELSEIGRKVAGSVEQDHFQGFLAI